MKITDDVNDRLLPPATTCPDMFEAKKKNGVLYCFYEAHRKRKKKKEITETISSEIEVEGWIVFSTRR